MRKRTVFKLCSAHEHYGGGYDTAKMFVEGGPSRGVACQGGYCEVRPGANYYAPTLSDDEGKTISRSWDINQKEMSA